MGRAYATKEDQTNLRRKSPTPATSVPSVRVRHSPLGGEPRRQRRLQGGRLGRVCFLEVKPSRYIWGNCPLFSGFLKNRCFLPWPIPGCFFATFRRPPDHRLFFSQEFQFDGRAETANRRTTYISCRWLNRAVCVLVRVGMRRFWL